MTARKRRPRICLAASGGGHVRQILDLKPFWQEHDHYLVTEPTALGHSLATEYPTRFVDPFAFGQARIASRATLRSEEHTSDQSLMRISYAVFCLKKNSTLLLYCLDTLALIHYPHPLQRSTETATLH